MAITSDASITGNRITCTKCNVSKLVIHFERTSKTKRKVCKFCVNERKQEWKRSTKKGREATSRWYNKWRKTDPAHVMVIRAKSFCKKNNLPFNLTEDDLKPLPKICPVLGIRLEYCGTVKNKDHWASMDRLVPSKGYVKGNVSIISFRANKIKNNAKSHELRAIADWIDSCQE